MKTAKLNNIIKLLFFTIFIGFLIFYVMERKGYYEYAERKKMTFTKEQIEQFERDVKDGKNIDINEYVKNTNKNYQNKISKLTLNISENISKYTKKGVDVIFRKIQEAIE